MTKADVLAAAGLTGGVLQMIGMYLVIKHRWSGFVWSWLAAIAMLFGNVIALGMP